MPTIESLTAKRASLTNQLEQHVGQINRINGAVALLDDLIAEAREEEADMEPPVTDLGGIDRASNPFWINAGEPAPMTPPAPYRIQPVTYEAPDEDVA